jgi:hypothetical protein
MQYQDKLSEVANMVKNLIDEGQVDANGNVIDFDWAEFLAEFELIELTGEELKVYNALENAYSFIIKNDELFIYFTANTNKNLLILEKN